MRTRRLQNRLLVFGALIIVAAGLIYAGQQLGLLRPLVTLLMVPIRPAAGVLTDGTEGAVNLLDEREDYAALEARNLELERAVASLQVEIVRLREIEQDYYRLSELVNYSAQRPDQNLVTADVIASDTSGYLRWVIINRGAREGIQIGAPVINELGLVGRVEDVTANAAWVRLIIDPSSLVDARLQTARAEGTVSGQLQGTLLMDYITQEALIAPGDLVLTSGLGGKFPPNIVIGQVASVNREEAALFQQAVVRPTVDFSQLKIVSVITSFTVVNTSVFDETIQSQQEPGQ